jgi:predicted DNA-binding transcriptional regulator AlpA
MSETLNYLKERYDKLGLSRTELAKELNLSLATLDRMFAHGDDLPKYRKIGGRYFFLLSDVASYLEDRGNRSEEKEVPG